MGECIWNLGGLFLLTFLSEDAAVLAGGIAVTGNPAASTSIPIFMVSFLGIWAGDLALYLMASHYGQSLVERFWGSKPSVMVKLNRSAEWFRRYGIWALVVCRIVPGMRLPTYLSAGLLRMPLAFFTLITGILAAAWVAMVFLFVGRIGKSAPDLIQRIRANIGWFVLGILLLLLLIRLLPAIIHSCREPRRLLRRLHWEFWPAWIFYFPVAMNYFRLSMRYRGLTLPSCANPGMSTGGLIGESKFVTLRELEEANPDHVATSCFLGEGTDRMPVLESIMQQAGLTYPVVLKPDVAQRGSGFKVAHSCAEASTYLSRVSLPVVIQRYIPGPHEAGIFYYRLPGEERGQILAITEKVFPVLEGNGKLPLKDLILADSRASTIAETYLNRFERELNRIPSPGERIRLVEAGNHAQGCIFRDGMDLWSEDLERQIDMISRSINGFFIGRYDLRYSDPELFAKGKSFQILELNGASSEATSAYDASKSLIRAYEILFRQWDLVFEIACRNRDLGHQPDSVRHILSEWLAYREQSRSHPAAD